MTKLSCLPPPVLAGVVRERTAAAAAAGIKNCLYDGADMIDLHLSCLEKNDTEPEDVGNPANFTSGVMGAFSGYFADELESNTGELLNKRFAVLAACAHGKTSSDGYFTEKSGDLYFERGGTFTVALLRAMGCKYPGGKLSGARKQLTLKQAYDGVKSEVSKMNKLLKKYDYIAYYAGDRYNSPGYYIFDSISQAVQMGGSGSTVLFRK